MLRDLHWLLAEHHDLVLACFVAVAILTAVPGWIVQFLNWGVG